jgi:hypothetical protein
MLKIVYAVVLIAVSFAATAQNSIRSGFEVDADVKANTENLDTNDWFGQEVNGSFGIGILDTSQSSFYYNFFSGATAGKYSTTFRKKGILSYLDTVSASNAFLDATFGRDFFSGSGYVDSTAFVIASKNGEPPSEWHPGVGQVLGKNDIIDVYGYAQREGFLPTDSLYVFCALTLNTTSGERYVDFEFFQKDVTYFPESGVFFEDGAEQEGHVAFQFDGTGNLIQYGDIILAVSIGSSGLESFDVRVWMKKTDYESYKSNPPANLPFAIPAEGNIEGAGNRSLYGYGTIIPKNGGSYNVVAKTNQTNVSAPPWGSISGNGDYITEYEAFQFFELGFNLTHAGLDPNEDSQKLAEDPCARTFYKYMVKSRASNSFSAQLKDFVGPYNFGGPEDPEVVLMAPKTILGCNETEGIPITANLSNPDVKSSDYYFLWLKGQDTLINLSGYDSTEIKVTEPGWYKVQILAQDYCKSVVDEDSIQIFEQKIYPGPPSIAAIDLCPEAPLEAFEATGITDPGLSVIWYDALTGGNVLDTGLTYLPATVGTYYAETINLITGCRQQEARVAANIARNSGASISLGSVSNTCNGETMGGIDVDVIGNTPISYEWSNGGITEDLTNLSGGNYFLKVTDNKGCVDTMSFTVDESPLITTNPSIDNVLCFNDATGSIDPNATGGTGALTYSWSNSLGTSSSVTNLSSGTYSLTITDAEACTYSETFNITEPAQTLSATVKKTEVLCKDSLNGGIEIMPSGGTPNYTYAWSGGGTSKDSFGLAAGTYQFTVTDANNCTYSSSAILTEPTALSVTLQVDSVICYGESNGKIFATSSGGTPSYSYLWNTGGTKDSAVNLSAGDYFLTVTDGNGCTVKIDTMVKEPQALSVTLESGSTTDSVSCYGGADGKIRLTVAGGTPVYSYNWSEIGAADLDSLVNLSAGNYSVTVSDSKGCQEVKNYKIGQPLPMLIEATVTDAACPATADGRIDITVSGGVPTYAYAWVVVVQGNTLLSSPSAEDQSGLLPGSYKVTVTDQNSCTAENTSIVGNISPVPTQPTNISKN